MQSLSLVLESDMGEQFFHLWVRVYEGFLFDTYTRIHHLAIKRGIDDSFIIIFIEYDT